VSLKPGQTPQSVGGHGAPNTKETYVLLLLPLLLLVLLVLLALTPLLRYVLRNKKAPGSSAGFGGANGGEYRKSFHGYPSGTAQLIFSPHSFTITPMQIDIWNRELGNVSGVPGDNDFENYEFHPGPVPHNNLSPLSGPDAIYSGLLECPLTTRVRKVIAADYAVRAQGTCGELVIQTAAECFQAASKLLPNTTISTSSHNDPKAPAGCTIKHAKGAAAGGSAAASFNQAKAATGSCGLAGSSVSGGRRSLVNLSLMLTPTEARITMNGPADVWFGAGFNASQMGDEPWAIIVDGKGAVTERKLVDQKAGTLLQSSVTVVSSTVAAGIRTVEMTRPLKGASPEYYTFELSGSPHLNFIDAVGSTSTFSYHKSKTPSSLLLLPLSAPACVCAGKPMPFGNGACKGAIAYIATNQTEDKGAGTVNFNNECAPQPLSQLLTQVTMMLVLLLVLVLLVLVLLVLALTLSLPGFSTTRPATSAPTSAGSLPAITCGACSTPSSRSHGRTCRSTTTSSFASGTSPTSPRTLRRGESRLTKPLAAPGLPTSARAAAASAPSSTCPSALRAWRSKAARATRWTTRGCTR